MRSKPTPAERHPDSAEHERSLRQGQASGLFFTQGRHGCIVAARRAGNRLAASATAAIAAIAAQGQRSLDSSRSAWKKRRQQPGRVQLSPDQPQQNHRFPQYHGQDIASAGPQAMRADLIAAANHHVRDDTEQAAIARMVAGRRNSTA